MNPSTSAADAGFQPTMTVSATPPSTELNWNGATFPTFAEVATSPAPTPTAAPAPCAPTVKRVQGSVRLEPESTPLDFTIGAPGSGYSTPDYVTKL